MCVNALFNHRNYIYCYLVLILRCARKFKASLQYIFIIIRAARTCNFILYITVIKDRHNKIFISTMCVYSYIVWFVSHSAILGLTSDAIGWFDSSMVQSRRRRANSTRLRRFTALTNGFFVLAHFFIFRPRRRRWTVVDERSVRTLARSPAVGQTSEESRVFKLLWPDNDLLDALSCVVYQSQISFRRCLRSLVADKFFGPRIA